MKNADCGEFPYPHLTKKFLVQLPGRTEKMRDCLVALEGEGGQYSPTMIDNLTELNLEAHKLAGTAGSVGFGELTNKAIAVENSTIQILELAENIHRTKNYQDLAHLLDDLFREAKKCEHNFQ